MSGILNAFTGGSYGSVPGAPTIGTATATGSTTATVAFTAPTCTGGLAITGYQAVCVSTGTKTGTGASSPITVSGLSGSTTYTFKVRAQNAIGYGSYSGNSNSITTPIAPGSQSYTTPGTYTWTVPCGVTTASVVAIGGGYVGQVGQGVCCGGCHYAIGGYGAGSGAIVWGNNLSVSGSIAIRVGAGNAGPATTLISSFGGTRLTMIAADGQSGGQQGTSSTCKTAGADGAQGGNPFSFNGGGLPIIYANAAGGGGAGAVWAFSGTCFSRGASYSGSSTTGASGTGGGGGGGGAAYGYAGGCAGYPYGGGGGGGIGILGAGSSGSGGYFGAGGSGGSGGSSGSAFSAGIGGAGGAYGAGGGGGATVGLVNKAGGQGASGAVRIIWPGTTRSFPSTCAGSP